MAVGCKAQTTPQATLDPATSRRIEVMVRSQFNVPQDVNVAIGARKPSQIAGYDALPVTLSNPSGTKSQVIDFLISTDGKTLARLEKFDLVNDPVFSIDVAGRPIRGNPAAKVTIINFDDLECAYCARLHQELFPATLEHYKDKVRFIYKDNPLPPRCTPGRCMPPWMPTAWPRRATMSTGTTWIICTLMDGEINGESRDLPQSFAALDRIARQEATLGKLDAAKLDACLAKQDESEVRASMKEAKRWAWKRRPQSSLTANASKAAPCPGNRCGW